MSNRFLLNFESLFDDLKEFVLVVDEFGKILNLNNTAFDMLGFDKQEIINSQISNICCDRTIEDAIQSNVFTFNTNLRTKYKQIITAKGRLDIINCDLEKLFLLKLYKVDEVINNTSADNFKFSLGYTYFIKDIDGKYIFVNDYFQKYFKKSKDEVMYKYDTDVWGKDVSYKFRMDDLQVISTKSTYTSYNSQIIDDKLVYYEVSKSPILDKDNNVAFVVGITRDITESVKLRNELVVQNEQLSIIYKILNNSYSNLNLKNLFSII